MTLLYHLDYYKTWFQTLMTQVMKVQKNCYMSLVRGPEKTYILFLKGGEEANIKIMSLQRFYLEQNLPTTQTLFK